jgi:hypothetical protein
VKAAVFHSAQTVGIGLIAALKSVLSLKCGGTTVQDWRCLSEDTTFLESELFLLSLSALLHLVASRYYSLIF